MPRRFIVLLLHLIWQLLVPASADSFFCRRAACSKAGSCCDAHRDQATLHCVPECRDGDWWVVGSDQVCEKGANNTVLQQACARRAQCLDPLHRADMVSHVMNAEKCSEAHERFFDCLWGCDSRELDVFFLQMAKSFSSLPSSPGAPATLQPLEGDGACAPSQHWPPLPWLPATRFNRTKRGVFRDPDCRNLHCPADALSVEWLQAQPASLYPPDSVENMLALGTSMPVFGAAACCEEGGCHHPPACINSSTGLPIADPCLCLANPSSTSAYVAAEREAEALPCQCAVDPASGGIVPNGLGTPCGPFCPCEEGLYCEGGFQVAEQPLAGPSEGYCVPKEGLCGGGAEGAPCSLTGVNAEEDCGCDAARKHLTCSPTGETLTLSSLVGGGDSQPALLASHQCTCRSSCGDGICTACEGQQTGADRCEECGPVSCIDTAGQAGTGGTVLSDPCLCRKLGIPLNPGASPCGECPSNAGQPCSPSCQCVEGECRWDFFVAAGTCGASPPLSPTASPSAPPGPPSPPQQPPGDDLLSPAPRRAPAAAAGWPLQAIAAAAASWLLPGLAAPWHRPLPPGVGGSMLALLALAALVAPGAEANHAGCDYNQFNSCTKGGHCCDKHDTDIGQYCPVECRAFGWTMNPWTSCTDEEVYKKARITDGRSTYDASKCKQAQEDVAECLKNCDAWGTTVISGGDGPCGDAPSPGVYPVGASHCCREDPSESYCGEPQACVDVETGRDIYDPCECQRLAEGGGKIVLSGSPSLPGPKVKCECPDGAEAGGECGPFCPCPAGYKCKLRESSEFTVRECVQDCPPGGPGGGLGAACSKSTFWFPLIPDCPCEAPLVCEDGECVHPPTPAPTPDPSQTPTPPPTRLPTPAPTKEPTTKQPTTKQPTTQEPSPVPTSLCPGCCTEYYFSGRQCITMPQAQCGGSGDGYKEDTWYPGCCYVDDGNGGWTEADACDKDGWTCCADPACYANNQGACDSDFL